MAWNTGLSEIHGVNNGEKMDILELKEAVTCVG